MPLHPAGLVVVFLAFAVAFRFVADRLDRDRIRKDVDLRGGHVLDITWKPFGRGWFGEKSDRVYLVEWEDAAREAHRSWCKTSMFTGVFWTEESAPAPGRGGSELEALRAENRRLREELERARKGRSGA
jgi:hypothetical protein